MKDSMTFIKTILFSGFLISIFAAAIFFMYGAYSEFQKSRHRYENSLHIYKAIECAARFSDSKILQKTSMNALSANFENFDISKLGCSDKEFFTNLDEIQTFRKGDWEKPAYESLLKIFETGFEEALIIATKINFIFLCFLFFCFALRVLFLSISYCAEWIFRR